MTTPGKAEDVVQRGERFLTTVLDRMSLRDVRLVKWCGEIRADEPDFEVRIDLIRLSPAEASYRLSEGRLSCRFAQKLDLVDREDAPLATLELVVVVDFDLDSALTREEERDLAGGFLNSVYGIAYPYVREAYQAMSLRLGLEPIVLGVVAQGEVRPQNAKVVGVAEFSVRGSLR